MVDAAKVQKLGKLTARSDTSGIEVRICAPKWFERSTIFSVANAPSHAATLKFTGDDLNFAARVLFAEATGSAVGVAADELGLEKQAILHVMYFRLNRKGYPSNKYVATSFRMVGEAPQVQFESVARATGKFVSTDLESVHSLSPANCNDLQACLDAVQSFVTRGPDFDTFPFDEFRSAAAKPSWKIIAKNAFHLTDLGKSYLAEQSR